MRCYQIDGFDVDPETGRLWRDREEITLRHKCRQLLLYFLAHAQQQITRDRLIEEVWQGEVSADAALSKTVAELRQALGDDAKAPRFVETLPKHGYRWIAPVSLGERALHETQPNPTVVTARPQPQQASALRWGLPIAVVMLALVMVLVAWISASSKSDQRTLDQQAKLVAQPAPPPTVVILPFQNATDEVAKDWLEMGLPDYIGSILNEGPHVNVVAVNQVDKWLRAHDLQASLAEADMLALQQSFDAQAVVLAQVHKQGETYALAYQFHLKNQAHLEATLTGSLLTELSEQLAQVIHEALIDVPFVNFNHAVYAADANITQRYIEARMLNYAGQLRKAKARYQALVELAPDFVWAKTGLASVMFSLGEFNETYDQLVADAEVLAKAQGSPVAQSMVMQLQAIRAKATGNPAEALRIFQAMYDHPSARDQDRAQVLLNMGAIYGELGQYDKERESYERAIALGVNPYDRALILNNLGAIATDKERYAEGRELLLQALALNRQLSEQNESGNNLLELGKNARLAGQPTDGAAYYSDAIELFKSNQNAFYEAEAWIGLGNCSRQLDQLDRAAETYVKARTILEKPAFAALPYYEKGMLSGLYVRMARLEAARGRSAEAQQLLQKAIEAYELMGNTRKVEKLREELEQWRNQTTG